MRTELPVRILKLESQSLIVALHSKLIVSLHSSKGGGTDY
jgi:hypothetical protein